MREIRVNVPQWHKIRVGEESGFLTQGFKLTPKRG